MRSKVCRAGPGRNPIVPASIKLNHPGFVHTFDRELAAGILKPAGMRRSLPRGVDADQVAALVGACDVATALGARDRALVMILVRLGLRAGEASRLRLDDIDWASGCLRVTGKGREHSLPLPVDVGQALEAWLRLRPPALDRAVFVRMRAPNCPTRSPVINPGRIAP